ncbi:hypothetical protein HZ326_20479 [Fusarium oxysporum f. sp. albedinis]|nr:hypothetical protein HZ326_20479 [Fusarium oxysporum f. sp. albedinis]
MESYLIVTPEPPWSRDGPFARMKLSFSLMQAAFKACLFIWISKEDAALRNGRYHDAADSTKLNIINAATKSGRPPCGELSVKHLSRSHCLTERYVPKKNPFAAPQLDLSYYEMSLHLSNTSCLPRRLSLLVPCSEETLTDPSNRGSHYMGAQQSAKW